jgi:hypothetical protein
MRFPEFVHIGSFMRGPIIHNEDRFSFIAECQAYRGEFRTKHTTDPDQKDGRVRITLCLRINGHLVIADARSGENDIVSFSGYHNKRLTTRPIGGDITNARNGFASPWDWDVLTWPLLICQHVTHILLTIHPFLIPHFIHSLDEMTGNALDHLTEPIEVRFDALTCDFRPLFPHGNSLTSF